MHIVGVNLHSIQINTNKTNVLQTIVHIVWIQYKNNV